LNPAAAAIFTATLDPDDTENLGTGAVEATDPLVPPNTSGGSPTEFAAATVASPGTLDSDLVFTCDAVGSAHNGMKIELVDNPGSGPPSILGFTPDMELRVQFD